MLKSIILGLLLFPSASIASHQTELIPYAIGYLSFICIVIFMAVRFVTRNLENNWNRFYIRVLVLPIIFSFTSFFLGFTVVAITIILLAIIYIHLYKAFSEWLRK